MRRKIELEYIFSSSIPVLFARLSTPAGFADWFADDVKHKGKIFTFVWENTERRAELLSVKKNTSVRFRWEDAEDKQEFFEFALEVEPLTGEVALLITDFVDEEDEEDEIELWDKQIESLHRVIGA